jgi:endonuclease/exonuclease/phosphatase family metal-dependent hydrolase
VYDRLDYIYVDHRFVTERAAYCYTEGTRAGSDHAYITATVRL